jgi:hypothetical protein
MSGTLETARELAERVQTVTRRAAARPPNTASMLSSVSIPIAVCVWIEEAGVDPVGGGSVHALEQLARRAQLQAARKDHDRL